MSHTERRQGAFISYARQDGEATARALQARLAQTAPDVPAWLDRLELEGGVGWWHQIERQLDRAEFLILVMTPAALRSENTRREWRSARQRGVCVYPVMGAPASSLDFASLPSWMGRAHFYDPAAEWETLVAHLRRGCQAIRVPFMAPPMPAAFVPRRRETDALIALLRSPEGRPVAITTALRGAGGFGKTTLATAICHDDRVLDLFDDGILWVTLGQTPNLLNELIKLHAALTGERPGFVDVEDATRELTLKLEHKNCLLVIDDVWSAAHVAPFLRAAAGCFRVITTRLFEVAADASRVDVDQMATAEATQLLLARAGVEPADEEPFRELAVRLGGWPLPITLVGSAIRQRLARGDSLSRALDHASKVLEKRGITAFDKADAADRSDAVARTVGASLDLLSADDQRRCASLSIFPEDTAIPLATTSVLWRLDDIDSEDLARRLDDLALLEFDLRLGTIRLHDVLRAFLAGRVADARALHGELVDAWGDPSALPNAYAWRQYTYHLLEAGRQGEARERLLDPGWLAAKLAATDVHALIADFDRFAGDPALDLVRDALRLAAPAIAQDASQLPAQLAGRLLECDEPSIVVLRARIGQAARRPWFAPLVAALDAPGGMLQMTLVGHEGGVTALSANRAHTQVLSASNDGTIRIWDREHGRLLCVLEHLHPGARAVCADDAGATAVSGGADGILYLWDLSRGERIFAFEHERGPAVSAAALSGNGRVAVSGSRERVVRIWDVSGRVAAGVLDGHTDRVASVALTEDGRRAVSGSEDGTLRVWDVASKTQEKELEGHGGPVNAVAVSPDGRFALSGSSDRTIRLWDLDAGTCLQTLRGHASSVTAVALAPGGWRALSGSSDQTARLWDLRAGDTLAVLDGHSDTVTAVAIDDAGASAATGSLDRTIKLWRLERVQPAASKVGHAGAVTALVFSGDGRLVASGGSDGRVIIREVSSGSIRRVIDAHSAPVRSLAFTEDKACVLSSGLDHSYWLWTVDEGGDVWLPVRHSAPVDYCAFSARARYLMTACGDRFVYLWDVPSGALVERYGTRRLFDHVIAPRTRRRPARREDPDVYLPGETVYGVDIIRMSADGTQVVLSARVRDAGSIRETRPGAPAPAAESANGVCLLWLNVETGQVQSLSTSQTEPISAFAVDTEAVHLLWAKADHSIVLSDLSQASHVATLRGHTGKVNAVAFTHDGRAAISCSRDRTLRLWTLAGDQVAAYTADSALRSLALSPCEPVIAAGDVAGRVHLLRLETE